MNKKQRKAQRAAELRRELGLTDDDYRAIQQNAQGPVLRPGRESGRSSGDNTAARTGDHKRTGTRLGKRDVKGPASFERPDEPAPPPVNYQALANEDADKAGVGQIAKADHTIDPKSYPRKHEAGTLKRADTVWYRGDRYFIEWAPKSWDKGCYVRICNRPVLPDPRLPTPSEMALSEIGLKEQNMKHAKGLLTFCVHPDLLMLAPPPVSTFARPPTQAEASRKERAARGERDVGDPVAVMLRDAKSLNEVYKVGANYLEMQVEDLRKRYGHLNPGQQRMNVGNKMRAKWRKEQK